MDMSKLAPDYVEASIKEMEQKIQDDLALAEKQEKVRLAEAEREFIEGQNNAGNL